MWSSEAELFLFCWWFHCDTSMCLLAGLSYVWGVSGSWASSNIIHLALLWSIMHRDGSVWNDSSLLYDLAKFITHALFYWKMNLSISEYSLSSFKTELLYSEIYWNELWHWTSHKTTNCSVEQKRHIILYFPGCLKWRIQHSLGWNHRKKAYNHGLSLSKCLNFS